MKARKIKASLLALGMMAGLGTAAVAGSTPAQANNTYCTFACDNFVNNDGYHNGVSIGMSYNSGGTYNFTIGPGQWAGSFTSPGPCTDNACIGYFYVGSGYKVELWTWNGSAWNYFACYGPGQHTGPYYTGYKNLLNATTGTC